MRDLHTLPALFLSFVKFGSHDLFILSLPDEAHRAEFFRKGGQARETVKGSISVVRSAHRKESFYRALTSARTNSGFDPQQAPTNDAPASRSAAKCDAKNSAVV
jgi:hypothetical protein